MPENPISPITHEQLTELLRAPRSALDLHAAEQIRLMQLGAVAALYADPAPEAAASLQEAALSHEWAEIRDLCQTFLETMADKGSQAAISALCELVIQADNGRAQQFTHERKLQPDGPGRQAIFLLLADRLNELRALPELWERLTLGYQDSPPEIRRRVDRAARAAGLEEWSQVVRAAVDGELSALAHLATSLPLFSSEILRDHALSLLADASSDPESPARKTFFDLFLETDYLPARVLLLELGFLPQDQIRRALFLLLTQQWSALETLDFTGTLTAQAYEASGPAVRRRMLAAVRRGGRVDLLQSLTRGRRTRWLGELGDTDWFTIFESLTHSGRWNDLWRLAQSAPPAWSGPMLIQLSKAGFFPETEADQAGFNLLLDLARESIGVVMGLHSPLERGLTGQESNCLAISPDGKNLAVGTSRSGITLFHLPDRSPDITFSSLPGPIWALAFSPDHEHLASGHGDFNIRIWNMPTGRLVKTLEGHAGVVRSLDISADTRVLISAGFDSLVRVWRFPAGPERKVLSGHKGEIFAVAIAPDGSAAASGGSDGLLRIWSVNSGSLLSSLAGHTDTITTLTTTPDGAFLGSASRDATVRLWSFPEGSPVALIAGHDQLVTSLVFHPSGQFGASVGYDGRLLLWTVPDGQVIQSIDCGAGPLVGAAFLQSGETLYTLSKAGVIHEWDLRPLIWTRLPIEKITQTDSSSISAALEDPRLGKAEQRWLKFTLAMARWRRRHDIALSEPERIQVGEFDIEIE